jgi:membrane protease YdiL (CAAX protease family)
LIILAANDNKNIWSYFSSPADILKMWLFVGIGEELFFRGYLLTKLLQNFERLPKFWAVFTAIICSDAIFMVYHLPSTLYNQSHGNLSPGIADVLMTLGWVFILGLLFSYFYIRTHNILLCGLLHGTVDAPLITFSKTNGGQLLQILVFAIIFAAIIEVTLLVKRRRQIVPVTT